MSGGAAAIAHCSPRDVEGSSEGLSLTVQTDAWVVSLRGRDRPATMLSERQAGHGRHTAVPWVDGRTRAPDGLSRQRSASYDDGGPVAPQLWS